MYRAAIAFVLAGAVSGQVPEPPVVIEIETDNHVLYRDNTTDVSRIAKVPTPTSSINIAFRPGINVADIVALNGKAARGIYANTFVAMPYRSNPAAGEPIADANGTATFHCTWHILAADGAYIGTIQDSGGGPSPDHIVVGGSGAFFGIIGVHQTSWETIIPFRGALTEEDPANRRINGGGKFRVVFRLYPKYRPAVDVTPAGPAVFHADFSRVTPTSPARAGEVLIVGARNLGPTRPDLLPPGSRAFKSDPLEVVNSPVEVMVNGREAEVINKVGWPGTSDLYRLDFRVPAGLPPGQATIQLTAAWIPGPEVKIPMQ